MDLSEEGLEDDVLVRLVSFPNVLITSHQAFFTNEAMTRIVETTMANMDAYFKGNALQNEICYQCNEPTCRKNVKSRCFLKMVLVTIKNQSAEGFAGQL